MLEKLTERPYMISNCNIMDYELTERDSPANVAIPYISCGLFAFLNNFLVTLLSGHYCLIDFAKNLAQAMRTNGSTSYDYT